MNNCLEIQPPIHANTEYCNQLMVFVATACLNERSAIVKCGTKYKYPKKTLEVPIPRYCDILCSPCWTPSSLKKKHEYCWWFRNPANHHLGCKKTCKSWDRLPTSTGQKDFRTFKQYPGQYPWMQNVFNALYPFTIGTMNYMKMFLIWTSICLHMFLNIHKTFVRETSIGCQVDPNGMDNIDISFTR